MAQKRKVQEAFGKHSGQLSAFALARLATEKVHNPEDVPTVATEQARNVRSSGTADVPLEPLNKGLKNTGALANGESIGPNGQSRSSKRRHVASNDNEEDTWTVSLDDGKGVYVVGEYNLRVLKGLVTIQGAVLHAASGSHQVHSPSTAGIPQILSRKDGTTIVLTSIKSSLRRLGRLSPLFRNIWGSQDGSLTRTFSAAGQSPVEVEQQGLNPLDVERDIQGIALRITGKSEYDLIRAKIMAVGSKSVGKSTLNRVLCNSILTRTLLKRLQYLDLDPGQPEFGVPGQVSLVEVTAPILGPPFSHVATVQSRSFKLVRAHTIASSTFKDDSAHYVACVKDLFSKRDAHCPLVVNSCGWTVGLGASIMTQIAHITGLTDVIAFDPIDESLLGSFRLEDRPLTIHRLARRPNRPAMRAPTELRAMQTQAYFHQRTIPSITDPTWSSRPLETCRPWLVPYTGEGSIFAVLSYNQVPHLDHLAEVLNGAVVAIVVVDPEVFGLKQDSTRSHTTAKPGYIQTTTEGIPYVVPNQQGYCAALDPAKSECIGHGLIRGIDGVNQQLQIISPICEARARRLALETVVLVRGGFDSPDWAYLEALYAQADTRGGGDDSGGSSGNVVERPWVGRKELVGVEGAVWRLRHPPVAPSRP